MYFLAYLLVGFHSHLHLSSFNINTYIYMKGECKTVPSLCKRGGGIYFCKINVSNKKLLFFWLLLQYTWSGILNLINIIHVPQSITMMVTSPCVMCAALFRPCVLCTAMFWPRVLRTVLKQNNHFGNFIYIKKIKWQYVACTCTIILPHVIFGVCLLDFLVFNIPEILELFDFVCHVCCGSWWKLKILIIILIYKEVLHNIFVDQYSIWKFRPSALFFN